MLQEDLQCTHGDGCLVCLSSSVRECHPLCGTAGRSGHSYPCRSRRYPLTFRRTTHTGGGDGIGHTGDLARMLCHGFCRFFGDQPIRQLRLRQPQYPLFAGPLVADQAGVQPLRCPRHRGQCGDDIATRTALCCGDGGSSPSEQCRQCPEELRSRHGKRGYPTDCCVCHCGTERHQPWRSWPHCLLCTKKAV